jgi:hypothetical protein
MNSLANSPESEPLGGQIYTAAYWPMAETLPRLTEVSKTREGKKISKSKARRTGKLALMRAVPQILSNQLQGKEVSFAEEIDVRGLAPGTIVLYDLEALSPGPMKNRDRIAEQDEAENQACAARLEMLLSKSARELIRHCNQPVAGPRKELLPGRVYTAGEISEHWFYHLRSAWMAIVPPERNRRKFSEYSSIALMEPADVAKINRIPKMNSASMPLLPPAFEVGKARRLAPANHLGYGDFREGVEVVRSAELIDPSHWEEAIIDDPGPAFWVAWANTTGHLSPK